MSIASLTMNEKVSLLKELYHDIASKGQDGDTMLAHINPEEAALLKAHGGSGTINPATGLPEYKKAIKTVVKIAAVAATAYYGGLPALKVAGDIYGKIQQRKYQKKQITAQREQVVQQNKANEARNRYNKLLMKRAKIQEQRQGRIAQGQIVGATSGSGLGLTGTSSFTGAMGNIASQTAVNVGNYNVAESTGDQISGYNQAASDAGSRANTYASRMARMDSLSGLGDTIFEGSESIETIFKKVGTALG